jgi:iron complex outermembrane recepter protein
MECSHTMTGRLLYRAGLMLILPAALFAQGNGTLVGRVLSADVAVPSATIVASNGRATLARVDGRFRLVLPAGRYAVRARAIGYASSSDSVTIDAGMTTTANFVLQRPIATLRAVSTLGSRGSARTLMDAPVPIDVFAATDLKSTGRIETAQMIEALLPGASVPHASVAEGSDVIHPFAMRGMGPDQVLVLVNGRRRHSSALLDVNGSVGRGATGVDLNAIPASMIDHVEILRDGASAQYGSDAVAGVVNVVLKSGVHGDAVTTLGSSATTYNRADDTAPTYPTGERSASDGRSLQASIDKGVVFGARGFAHGALEIRDRGYTNRSLPDLRPQYLPGDPRAGASGLPADLMTHRLGDPGSHDVALFLNGGNLFTNGLEMYSNAGWSRRTMSAAGVYRTAADPRTVLATFPDGFLPQIRPTIDDQSASLGLKGFVSDWSWDLSTTYGRNEVAYQVNNTVDGGLATSQTSFDAGSVRYGQSTTNLELFRSISLFGETRLATGLEWRAESYGIRAGSAPSVFIQGFSGFGTTQAVERSRHDGAAYVDLESDLTSAVTVGMAGRLERYSDVGTVGAGKVTARVEPVRAIALRGSIGRDFRAPALAQSFYSDAATDPGTGAVTTRVARVDEPAAISAGATALRPERSTHYTVGVAAELTDAVSLSADLYRMDVKDRVILLDAIADGPAGAPFFLANGADTRTDGLDVRANYGYSHRNGGALRLTAGANFNNTAVTRDATSGTLGLGRIGTIRLERGQPRNSLLAAANYTLAELGVFMRVQRYGDVTVARLQDPATPAQTFDAKWVSDASISYRLKRKYTLTFGADNLFDIYPDRNNLPGDPNATGAAAAGNGYFGIFPYSGASPFGFNGRFLYTRLSIYL